MSYLAQCAEAVIPDLEFLERNKRASGKPFYADCVLARIQSLQKAIEEEKSSPRKQTRKKQENEEDQETR